MRVFRLEHVLCPRKPGHGPATGVPSGCIRQNFGHAGPAPSEDPVVPEIAMKCGWCHPNCERSCYDCRKYCTCKNGMRVNTLCLLRGRHSCGVLVEQIEKYWLPNDTHNPQLTDGWMITEFQVRKDHPLTQIGRAQCLFSRADARIIRHHTTMATVLASPVGRR